MKKSEAIKKSAIEFAKRSDAQQYKGYSDEGLAEEFLDIFEKIVGMAPPDWDNTVYGYNEGFITAPEWEEE